MYLVCRITEIKYKFIFYYPNMRYIGKQDKILSTKILMFHRSFLARNEVLFVCLVGFLTSSSTTRLYRGRAPRQERLTILRAATHETELGDHDFCLSRSHYTDTGPTCRERAATAGIEPGTSSPGVARSTAELPRPPPPPPPPEMRKRTTLSVHCAAS